MISRPDPAPALLAVNQSESSAAGTTLNAAAIGPSVQLGTVPPGLGSGEPRPREITASFKVIEPNYTIEAGDTLGRIAVRFNTTVERVQGLNNLADPRALRIGAKLVIPPPF
jgi:LysM repeat protein